MKEWKPQLWKGMWWQKWLIISHFAWWQWIRGCLWRTPGKADGKMSWTLVVGFQVQGTYDGKNIKPKWNFAKKFLTATPFRLCVLSRWKERRSMQSRTNKQLKQVFCRARISRYIIRIQHVMHAMIWRTRCITQIGDSFCVFCAAQCRVSMFGQMATTTTL